jgi:hypothetical protein
VRTKPDYRLLGGSSTDKQFLFPKTKTDDSQRRRVLFVLIALPSIECTCTQRKLDEQRAKAVEKTQNEVAKARRKAEEKRASAEAKRGLKLAKVLELANFMKAVGRVPTKRSFF